MPNKLLADMSSCILARSKKKKSFVRNSTFAASNSFEDSFSTTLTTAAVMEAEREFLMRYRHHSASTSEDALSATPRSQRSNAM